MELLEKANAELKTAKQKELDEVELRGYDFCFDEQVAAVKGIQGRLYQAAHDFGLDQALIPSTSELRTPVAIPNDFQYEVAEVEQVHDETSQARDVGDEGVLTENEGAVDSSVQTD